MLRTRLERNKVSKKEKGKKLRRLRVRKSLGSRGPKTRSCQSRGVPVAIQLCKLLVIRLQRYRIEEAILT